MSTAGFPGTALIKLVYTSNCNPKPRIKVYVGIQLFEHYKELHYITRKLKHHQVISNYRLDENGRTNIALRLNTKSFRFIGMEQLSVFGFELPQELLEEIQQRKSQIARAETQSSQNLMQKALNLPHTVRSGSALAEQSIPTLPG